MELLVFILALIFVAYVAYIYDQYGFLHSISASFYELEKDKKGWLFTAFTWFLAVGMILIGLAIESSYLWIFFIAGSGGAFTGAASRYESKGTTYVHYIGSTALIIASVVGIGVIFGTWLPTYVLGVTGFIMVLTRRIINNPLYWFELLAFICIIAGLLGREN